MDEAAQIAVPCGVTDVFKGARHEHHHGVIGVAEAQRAPLAADVANGLLVLQSVGSGVARRGGATGVVTGFSPGAVVQARVGGAGEAPVEANRFTHRNRRSLATDAVSAVANDRKVGVHAATHIGLHGARLVGLRRQRGAGGLAEGSARGARGDRVDGGLTESNAGQTRKRQGGGGRQNRLTHDILLVSPGNPADGLGPAPFPRRFVSCESKPAALGGGSQT